MDCFRCGQEGHARSQCPMRWPLPAATRASPVAVTPDTQRVPARREPDPPTPAYLETRKQLGMPTHAERILIACPWCRAGPYQQCINTGTQRETRPHQARLDAAGIQADAADRELARAQLAESRARRLAHLDVQGSQHQDRGTACDHETGQGTQQHDAQ